MGNVIPGFDERFDNLDSTMGDRTIRSRVEVKVLNPKKLSPEEFKDLKGSLLYGRMFKNRCILLPTGSQFGTAAFMRDVSTWADDSTSGFFCIDHLTLYFEKSVDAVAFHLRFNGVTEQVTTQTPKPHQDW